MQAKGSVRFFVFATMSTVALLGAPTAHAGTAQVGVTHAMDKVRPSHPAPAATSASLEAARNEFEAFQIVLRGASGGVQGVTATASALLGPDGATIPASNLTLYRVGLYDVVTASNVEGAPGPWPDPLIPDVDPYAGEKRNAFPFDVPDGQSRAIWVDVYVPLGTPAGTYTGAVTLTGQGLGTVAVPVTVKVRGFDLPSTASLKSAFGMGWDDACIAHHGSYQACGADAGIEKYHVLYARAALDHRVSLETVVYYFGDQGHFDSVYGPLLDGTAPTRLPGAKLTTVRLNPSTATLPAWKAHFDAKGWGETAFDYTCDEPPAGCAWSSIAAKAAAVQAAGVKTLVTTDLSAATNQGLLEEIDILVPVVNQMHPKGGVDQRGKYEAFLGMTPAKELWWYQSCMSHGCGNGCSPTTDPWYSGWPSYMVDVAGIQNRAMEWLSYKHRVTGELYFQTTHMLDSAWANQCDFSGNGDGTLFYPGTPALIGGTSHIPVESIRLKLIREGMADYEYLHLLDSLGDGAFAEQVVGDLFPAASLIPSTTPEAVLAARAALADRIEELLGSAPPPVTCEPTTCAAAGAECGAVADGCGGALDCGGCAAGEACGLQGANQCSPEPPACVPTSCAAAGAGCGDVADGCGGVLDCGGCGPNEACGLDAPNQCGAVTVPTLPVARAAGPVVVDGDLPEYEGAQEVILASGDAVGTFRVLWDEQALYVGVDVVDPDLRATGTGKDSDTLWLADGVELLLDPALTASPEPDDDDRHVIVTVLGDLFDAQGAGAGADTSFDLGVDRQVIAEGTVADALTDTGYRVEMAIPWPAVGVAPAVDVELGGDLALNNDDTVGYATSDWAGLAAYAQPQGWNRLRLSATQAMPVDTGGADAGSGGADAGSGGVDAGSGGADAGSGGADAGPTPTEDAGPTPDDTGGGTADTGGGTADTGGGTADTGGGTADTGGGTADTGGGTADTGGGTADTGEATAPDTGSGPSEPSVDTREETGSVDPALLADAAANVDGCAGGGADPSPLAALALLLLVAVWRRARPARVSVRGAARR